MPSKNLALEMLKKLPNDQITSTRRTSIVQSREFSEKQEESLNRYHNRGLEMAQITEALINRAQTMREELGPKGDEYAFYWVLAMNESAVQVMGGDQLQTVSREVAQTVRQNASIDWRQGEKVRAEAARNGSPPVARRGAAPDACAAPPGNRPRPPRCPAC